MRDLISRHSAVDKVPYDINYIWRLGNENLPHDELPPPLLTKQIRRQIVRYFGGYCLGAPFLIEKTVSNCLRIPYVNAVFPNAKFIHLVRNGLDVVESAYRQWTAPPNWRYIRKKAMTFPLMQAPGYALSYAMDILQRVLTKSNKGISAWGPRYRGIEEDIASKELLEVCAIQWARCVKKAMQDLDNLSDYKVLTVRYEDFGCDPRQHLKSIARFVGLNPEPYADLDVDVVSKRNIGKGHRNLNADQKALIKPYIEETALSLGYDL
jgi:hypothetical protein